jgi:hypothetical protein
MVATVGDLLGAVIVQSSPGLLKTEVQTGLQAPFICQQERAKYEIAFRGFA